MPVKPIPDGYRSVTPYLIVDDAAAALEFYAKVFGAVERMRIGWDGDRIGHAEFEIGDSLVMLASEFPDMQAVSPATVGGTPVSFSVYVEDADGVFARAIEEGATEIRPVADQFYGDRSGTFRDPSGHIWSVATHIEDVTPEELDRRRQELLKQSS